MREVFESVTVTISKREYTELVGKAFAYDAYKRYVKENRARGGYNSSLESALFLTDDVIDVLDTMQSLGLEYEEDDMEEISPEAWDEIEEIAGEKE